MKWKSSKSWVKKINKILRTPNSDHSKSELNKESELKDIKKSMKIDQNVDYSYLDEATKLKEEEVAKTTLINNTTEIEGLLNLKRKKKKK